MSRQNLSCGLSISTGIMTKENKRKVESARRSRVYHADVALIHRIAKVQISMQFALRVKDSVDCCPLNKYYCAIVHECMQAARAEENDTVAHKHTSLGQSEFMNKRKRIRERDVRDRKR